MVVDGDLVCLMAMSVLAGIAAAGHLRHGSSGSVVSDAVMDDAVDDVSVGEFLVECFFHSCSEGDFGLEGG